MHVMVIRVGLSLTVDCSRAVPGPMQLPYYLNRMHRGSINICMDNVAIAALQTAASPNVIIQNLYIRVLLKISLARFRFLLYCI